MTETRTVQERLRWGSKAIFLVTETEVATGVRDLFLQAADRIDALEKALGKTLMIISELDKYQKRPERGDHGTECACCMGELFDRFEREDIAFARAALSPPSDTQAETGK